MKFKYFIFVISLIVIGCKSNVSNLNYGSFYYFQKYDNGSDNTGTVLTGELIKNVNIYNINENNRIKIRIEISMTGSGILMGETIAENINGRYEFSFIDNWDNNAFGHIIFNDDETIIFYLDCNEFSDFGKTRVGRLYGVTTILQKGILEYK
jgi:hypothetical protein